MEAGHTHLLNLLVLLLGAIVAVVAARRLRFSPVVGYLAAGIAIGLDLPLRRLQAMWRYIFGLGLAQVAATSALAGAAAAGFGFGWEATFVIGGAVAFSSTAAVLQLLSERQDCSPRRTC